MIRSKLSIRIQGISQFDQNISISNTETQSVNDHKFRLKKQNKVHPIRH